MRIALFTETFLPKVDGVVAITLQMLNRMRHHGHEVIVFAPPTAPTHYEDIRVYPSWGPRFPLYRELYCSMPTYMGVQGIRNFRPDLIHVMNPTFIGAVGTMMAQIGRVPLVASTHMDIDYYVTQYAGAWGINTAWRYFRIWHNRAQLNLAPSQSTLEQLQRNGIQRTAHWSRGIDLTRFRRTTRNEALRMQLSGGHPDDLLILYVGRLSKEKNIDALKPLTQLPGVRVALVGGGPQTARARQHFAGTNAYFAGVLQGEALIDAYNAADLFVFPSQSETFGLAPLEAMACGIPVVAPFVGGLRDTMRDGSNGIVYDHHNPDSLIAAVQLLQHNETLRHTLAHQAWAYAQHKSWQGSMDQLIDYYQQVYQTHQLKQFRTKTEE